MADAPFVIRSEPGSSKDTDSSHARMSEILYS